MRINPNKAYDLLRQYAEDYGNIKYLYDVYEKLSSNTYTVAVGARLNSLHQKKVECMTKYFDLYGLCELQADEENEIKELVSAKNEYQKERAMNLFNYDKGEI